jgi:hypothetical protein
LKTLLFVSVAFASALALSPLTANAASVVDNTNLASPGVYFGTGNPNGGFETETVGNVEIGIRGKVNQGAVPTPVNGNEYDFVLGTKSNFDYSVNPDLNGTPFSLAGVMQVMLLQNLNTNVSTSYDPSTLSDNDHSLSAVGGYQNSEQFSFFPVGFDRTINGTYKATLSLTGGQLSGPMQVSAVFKYGNGGVIAGVPEPATWAIMLIGFGGIGATLRRRRSSLAHAAVV